MKKPVTINHFTPIIPHCQIDNIMGVGMKKKFLKWMEGQTVQASCKNFCETGYFVEDVARFLRNQSNND